MSLIDILDIRAEFKVLSNQVQGALNLIDPYKINASMNDAFITQDRYFTYQNTTNSNLYHLMNTVNVMNRNIQEIHTYLNGLNYNEVIAYITRTLQQPSLFHAETSVLNTLNVHGDTKLSNVIVYDSITAHDTMTLTGSANLEVGGDVLIGGELLCDRTFFSTLSTQNILSQHISTSNLRVQTAIEIDGGLEVFPHENNELPCFAIAADNGDIWLGQGNTESQSRIWIGGSARVVVVESNVTLHTGTLYVTESLNTETAGAVSVLGNTVLRQNVAFDADATVTFHEHCTPVFQGGLWMPCNTEAHLGTLSFEHSNVIVDTNGVLQSFGSNAFIGHTSMSNIEVWGALTCHGPIRTSNLELSGDVVMTSSAYLNTLNVSGFSWMNETMVDGSMTIRCNVVIEHAAQVPTLVTNTITCSNLHVIGNMTTLNDIEIQGSNLTLCNVGTDTTLVVKQLGHGLGRDVFEAIYTNIVDGSEQYALHLNHYGHVGIRTSAMVGAGTFHVAIQGTCGFMDDATMQQSVDIQSNLTVANHAFIAKTMQVNDGFRIAEDSSVHMSNACMFHGEQVVIDPTCTLRVNGPSVIQNTVVISGNTVLQSNVSVVGQTIMESNVAMKANLSVGPFLSIQTNTSNLIVNAISVFNNTVHVNALSVFTRGIVVNNSVNVSTDIHVQRSFKCSSNANLVELTVAKDALFETNVTVVGDVSILSALDVPRVDTNDVYVDSMVGCNVVASNLHVQDITIDHGIYGPAFQFNVNESIFQNKVHVDDEVWASNVWADESVATNSLTVFGESALEGNVTVSSSLEVLNSTILHSNMYMVGAMGVFSNQGRTRCDGELWVAGTCEFQDNVHTNKSISVVRDMVVGTDAYVQRHFRVSGNSVFEGNSFVCEGNMYVGGYQNITDGIDVHGPSHLFEELFADGRAIFNGGLQVLNGLASFSNVQHGGTSALPVYASANGTLMLNASDARMKENIVPIDDASGIHTILKLEPVSYHWSEAYKESYGSQKQWGLIAQDVMNVCPEVVNVAQSSGMYSVDYVQLIPLLIQSIQSLEARLHALEKQK